MIRDDLHYGKLAALCLALGLFCLLCLGCARPTAPTPTTAASGHIRLALAGQSNAMLLQPFLSERAEVPAFYGQVIQIAPCWDARGGCWGAFQPQLSAQLSARVDAFVWSQAESDIGADTPLEVYAAAQADLVARVRALQPGVLVVVVQLGPFYDNGRGGELGKAYQAWKRAWAASDPRAVYIETAGLEYRADEVHMTDQGYRNLAGRIVAAVTARTR